MERASAIDLYIHQQHPLPFMLSLGPYQVSQVSFIALQPSGLMEQNLRTVPSVPIADRLQTLST